MTFPVWSGINSDHINASEVNGAAATPLVQTDGFSSAVFPVLFGTYPGIHAEVMRTRPEIRAQIVRDETQDFSLLNENKNLTILPEDRATGVERSRKRYP